MTTRLQPRWLLTLLTTCALSGQAQAQELTLKIAHFLPSVATAQKQVMQPWCDQMGQLSNGRIKCQFYPSMQLGGTPGQLVEQAKTGMADIVWTAPGYSAGRFPKTEVLELPGVLPLGGLSGSRSAWAFYEQHLGDEYKDYKVLAMHGDGGMNLHTASKPLTTAADFKGIKLRSPNRIIARTLQTLGATPVAMPPAQVTEAIAKGVVDGASAVWEVLVPTKLDEVTKFHLETPADRPVMGATILVLLMNKARYDALPADLKAIIDKTSGLPLVERYGKAWDEAAQAARNKVKTSPGHTLTVMNNANYDALLKQLGSVEAEWLTEAKAKNINGAALLSAARQIASSHKN